MLCPNREGGFQRDRVTDWSKCWGQSHSWLGLRRRNPRVKILFYRRNGETEAVLGPCGKLGSSHGLPGLVRRSSLRPPHNVGWGVCKSNQKYQKKKKKKNKIVPYQLDKISACCRCAYVLWCIADQASRQKCAVGCYIIPCTGTPFVFFSSSLLPHPPPPSPPQSSFLPPPLHLDTPHPLFITHYCIEQPAVSFVFFLYLPRISSCSLALSSFTPTSIFFSKARTSY